MMKKVNILFIEDQCDTARHVTLCLKKIGFGIDISETIADGLLKLSTHSYDLVLLDLNLSSPSGFEIIKQIDSQINIPIIVLSSQTHTEIKVQAFRLGIDDYITKPFSLEELEVRILAILKRCSLGSYDYTKNALVMDYNTQTIFFNKKPLSLTAIEYKILAYLIENKNRVVHRNILAIHLSSLSSSQSLNYHIQNIRKKLNDNPKKPRYIMTEYGTGYRLVL